MAIVGGGFIGLEVAASCRARGLDVTVIEALPDPLSAACGVTLGGPVATIHRNHGVDLRTGVAVAGIEADVVVVGIGVVPNVEWLDGSGLTLDDEIVCDPQGRAGPDVHAAGDVARRPNAWVGGAVRIEHWTNAVEQGSARRRKPPWPGTAPRARSPRTWRASWLA